MSLDQQVETFGRLCPCCGTDPEYHPLSIFCDNMDLAEIGEGYVLYFKLIIYFGCITLVLLGINIYKLVINFEGEFCTPRPEGAVLDTKFSSDNYDAPPCYIDWITPHSIANYGIAYTDMAERAMMVIFLGLFYFALAIVRHRILKISGVIDSKNDTCSDFTLTVGSLLSSSIIYHCTTMRKPSKIL